MTADSIDTGRTAPQGLKNVVRRMTPPMLFAMLLSFSTAVLMFVPPLYMINVFDKVFYSHSLSTLIGISVAALIGILLFVALEFLRAKTFILIGNWLGQALNEVLLEPALGQSLRGKGSVGDTLKDVSELRQFVAGPTIASGLELAWSPLFFLVLFILHPAYFILAASGAGILILLAVINELMIRKPTHDAKQSAMVAYGDLGDALRNAEVIEGMGLMNHVLDRWQRSNDKTLRISQDAETKAGAVRALSRGIQFMLTMSVIALGSYLVIQGGTTMGTVIAAMIISGRAVQPYGAVITGWREWMSARFTMKRLAQVAADDAAKRPRSGMALPRPRGQVTVDRLVFLPPGSNTPALRGVSVEIEPGELVAVIGPSAAGKSTLAKMLVGVWAPTGGSVRLDGHEVYTWNRQDFGQYIGYLPQSVELFSGTVRENIARLSDAPAPKVIEAAKRAGVHQMVGQFPHGYDTNIGAFGKRLTGGQAQRVGLARALFGNPAMLVLDEPDASLDTEGHMALVSALEEAKADGVTTVVVSHRANLVRLADRVIVMRAGMIERIAVPDDLVFDDRGYIGVRGPQRTLQALPGDTRQGDGV